MMTVQYDFKLGDLCVKESKSSLGCLPLADLTEAQWEQFLRDTEEFSFTPEDRSAYNGRISVFMVNDEDTILGGLLVTASDREISVRGIASFGYNDAAIYNDLVFWADYTAQKRFGPDTTVHISLPEDPVCIRILMEDTGYRAERTD